MPLGRPATGIFELLIVLLVIGWLFGFAIAGLGEIIHILIVIAVLILLYRLLTGAYGRRGPLDGP